MEKYSINILHLYPDLLNLYGDKGNIECMRKRLMWRGIDVEVTEQLMDTENVLFSDADIIYIGGGSEREQETVCKILSERKAELSEYVENGGTLIATCSAYPMLGEYFYPGEKKVCGLGILNIVTDLEKGSKKLKGDVSIKCDSIGHNVVGFENHEGRTDIKEYEPLGKIIKGFGNNGTSGCEGVVYKNLIGTYLCGPLFPKNPQLCDHVLLNALKKKYCEISELENLDDKLEIKANEFISNRLNNA